MSNFWWGAIEKKTKIHWKVWNNICKRKDEGGIGFRNFRSFNEALLAKQIWRILTYPDSLVAKVLKAKYFPNNTFLDAELGYKATYVWESIDDIKLYDIF
jgi:hypothetical protein